MFPPRQRLFASGRLQGLSAAAAVLLLAAGCAGPPPADRIYENARFYTLLGEPPARVDDELHVQALAVRNGRIVALGTRAAMRRYRGPATEIVDLGGATVFPGFIDAHVHLGSLGRSLRELDLVGTRSYQEIVARVRERAMAAPPGTWITGRGWDQNDWADPRFPDHAALSDAVPDHPVYLRRIDGHAALANARALAQAGVVASTVDPPGGRIERRPGGAPSGVLLDVATTLVTRHIPPPGAAERRARLVAALEHCAAAGLTAVHDAGDGRIDVANARALLEAGALPLRLYLMWDGTADPDDPEALAAALASGPHFADASGRLAVRAVKFMVDGALGSRGATLLAPYRDAPGHRGIPQETAASLYARARPLHAAGFQLATHCIGDAANRLALDVYARLQAELPRPAARHRIEHAQVIAPEDLPRFAALGVLPSMQPTHCTSDMPWVERRLGPDRLRGAYAWRSLRATGVRIPAGSDAPVESVSPLAGIYAAVTRQDVQGEPAGGWRPEERLSRSEALRAFTSWAAYAGFAEAETGVLAPGRWCDLTVVDRDLFRVPAPEIATAQIRATVVGGVQVFLAPAAAVR